MGSGVKHLTLLVCFPLDCDGGQNWPLPLRSTWELTFVNNHAVLKLCLRRKGILPFEDANLESRSALSSPCGLGPQLPCLNHHTKLLLYGPLYQLHGADTTQEQGGLCRQAVPVLALMLSRTW